MKTAKGEQTRQRIVEHALKLFEQRGYAETTLREIAESAGVSIGLAYRYFDRKEELALALYQQLSQEVEHRVKLPVGSIGERWAALEHMRFKVLRPHRRTLLALFQAAIDPDGELGALSPATASVRERWIGLHRAVIEGAAGSRVPIDELVRLLYAVDLMVVVYWTQDRTANARATRDAIDQLARLIDLAMALPGVAIAIAGLAKSFDSLTNSKERT